MSEEQFLEVIRDWTAIDFLPEDLERLKALARIGLTVTRLPREIYEAANAIANFDGES